MADDTEISKLSRALDDYTASIKKQNPRGVRTSEFWVGIAAIVVVAGCDAFGLDLSPDTVSNILWTTLGYIGVRGGVKAAENMKK